MEYETLDRDEIVQRFPQFRLAENTIGYYSPWSGHGFKFGTVIGRILTDLGTQGHRTYPNQTLQNQASIFCKPRRNCS